MAASIYDQVTADWLKNTFLLGIDLTLDDGSPYPDVIYEQSIRGAVAYIEHELGIVIDPRAFVGERHDALDINRDSWWSFRLDRRPVLSFQKWTLQFGSYDPVDMPVRWLQLLSKESGQVHLIPSQDQLGSFLYSAGVPLIMGGFIQPYRYIPGYFGFNYTAGFDMRKGTATILDGQTEIAVTLDPQVDESYYAVALSGDAALGTLTITNRTPTGFTVQATAAASGDQVVSWSITTVPDDIVHLIGIRAAMLPIDIAGDLISGAGVANYSIGADGVHQSLGTTSSATNSGYGARRQAYERELKARLPALRAKYRQIGFGVI